MTLQEAMAFLEEWNRVCTSVDEWRHDLAQKAVYWNGFPIVEGPNMPPDIIAVVKGYGGIPFFPYGGVDGVDKPCTIGDDKPTPQADCRWCHGTGKIQGLQREWPCECPLGSANAKG